MKKLMLLVSLFLLSSSVAFGAITPIPTDVSATYDSVPVQLVAGRTISTNQVSVTTAGTKVALSATSKLVLSVTITANLENTGYIYVGGSTVSSTVGYKVAPGRSVTIDIWDLNSIYLDTATNGNGVSYIALTQ